MELQSRIIMDLATLNKQNEEHRSVAERNVLNLTEENARLKQQLQAAADQLKAANTQLDALAIRHDAVARDLAALTHDDNERVDLVMSTQRYARDIIAFAKEGNHPPIVTSVVQSLLRSLNGASIDDERAVYAGNQTTAVEGESAADSNVELDAAALVASAKPSLTDNRKAKASK